MVAEQLGLFLAERLSYTPQNFIVHSGVSGCIDTATIAFESGDFSILWIEGPPRFGKTHLAIKLTDLASRRGLIPFLVEGQALAQWLQERKRSIGRGEVLIVDDGDLFFDESQGDVRGSFVHLVEESRFSKGTLVFLSHVGVESLRVDDHVKSRLRPGAGAVLGAPSEEDCDGVIREMASQRGYRLKEKKLGYISRRVGRDIPSIERYFNRLSHLSRVLGVKIQYPVLGDAL